MTKDKLSPWNSSTFGQLITLTAVSSVTAMAISPWGRDVALAGRQGLYIIDLDDPFHSPRMIPHLTPWEVADIQWCPHPANSSWVVSTSNQKAIIWDLNKPSDSPDAHKHVLHGHSRAITDINFHTKNPNMLATCSVDSYVLIWDLRTKNEVPVLKCSDWRSGATQVKWNFINENIFASSHGSSFYIWDLRNKAQPLYNVQAHEAKINGLDFSKKNEHEIISASNDCTVKYWNYENSEEPFATIHTTFPVSRARHLPFGHGCGIMPLRGGHNSIYLCKRPVPTPENKVFKLENPVHVFEGHRQPVCDFLWRSRYLNDDILSSEYQLVTYSRDQKLILWPLNNSTYTRLSYSRNSSYDNHVFNGKKNSKNGQFDYITYIDEPIDHTNNYNVTLEKIRKNNINLKWISGISVGNNYLGEEVSHVASMLKSKIRFEHINILKGILTFSLNSPIPSNANTLMPEKDENERDYLFLRISFKFPKTYPRKGYPKFFIEDTKEIDHQNLLDIRERLDVISKKYTQEYSVCIEPCLRYLLGFTVSLEDMNDTVTNPDINRVDDEINSFANDKYQYKDDNDLDNESVSDYDEINPKYDINRLLENVKIPSPIKSAGRWTASNELVCFNNFPDDIMVTKVDGYIMKTNKSKMSYQLKTVKVKNELLSLFNKDSGLESESDEVDDTDLRKYWKDMCDLDTGSNTDLGFMQASEGMNQFNFYPIVGGIRAATNFNNKTIETNIKDIIGKVDFSHLIPSKKELAHNYRLLLEDYSADKIALYNSFVTSHYEYDELSDAWRAIHVALMKHPQANNKKIEMNDDLQAFDWEYYSNFTDELVLDLFSYFCRTDNVQMFAMMSCLLYVNPNLKTWIPNEFPCHFPYTKYPENNIANSFSNQVTDERQSNLVSIYDSSLNAQRLDVSNKTNADDSSTEEFTIMNEESENNIPTLAKIDSRFSDEETFKNNPYYSNEYFEILDFPTMRYETFVNNPIHGYQESVPLLNPKLNFYYEYFRKKYSEMLFFWGFPIKKQEILKYNYPNITLEETLKSKEFEYLKVGYDYFDKHPNLDCVYCVMPVKNHSFICVKCNHIMHSHCAIEWFNEYSEIECSSGCGCKCLI
ncbi:Mtc5p ASCRUDRAFT_56190 [Ascoidea rubescens DSM 1968]|uniref:RWD domain-containing protein n=1 Tax=Ascoidea rubescens DSM 1968 TaxID=1344418 RepID=A0A1D2VJS3_9ASCO|nr:hypothetical protein ASCRUDRAFT_56190 [Ascoidea rubescens DSM 1968]ODV61757.1 hypothetical protein ASCRUDRAFT_56190 [Ascoidea rubescens DSM 1968]